MLKIIFILITIDYAIFIGLLIYGFDKIKSFEINTVIPKTTFSIIVPFRNEETFFLNLLNSFSRLNYPRELFEIIVVDDASNDNSVTIFNKWRFENGLIETTLLDNLRLSNSPKKDAISRAVYIVKNTWIVTTDADCEVNENWLLVMDSYIQKNTVSMLVGAVNYTINCWNPLAVFQQMDMMSLQGTTIGSFGLHEPFMCNGANFAYKKSFFNELNGFNGNDNLASGDDVFLLQKAVEKSMNLVHYLKHKQAIVTTQPENNLFNLFMQRVRWASKTSSYKSDFAKGLAVLVLLMNFTYVLFFVILSLGLKFKSFEFLNWNLFFIFWIVKFVIDFILLFKTNQFTGKSKFILPVFSSFTYPFFCCLVGFYSFFGSFSWKGRRF